MGLVQRDGIHRLPTPRAIRGFKSTICVDALRHRLPAPGIGRRWGDPARDGPQTDLVVVWGGNPVNTQVNVMTHIARARKERGAKLVVVDPYRTSTAEPADIASGAAARHRRRAGLRHDARAVAGGLRRPRLSARATPTFRPTWSAHLRDTTPRVGGGHHRPAVEEIVGFRAPLRRARRAAILRLGFGFTRSRNGAAAMHAVLLPAGGDRRLAARRAAVPSTTCGDLYDCDKT